MAFEGVAEVREDVLVAAARPVFYCEELRKRYAGGLATDNADGRVPERTAIVQSCIYASRRVWIDEGPHRSERKVPHIVLEWERRW